MAFSESLTVISFVNAALTGSAVVARSLSGVRCARLPSSAVERFRFRWPCDNRGVVRGRFANVVVVELAEDGDVDGRDQDREEEASFEEPPYSDGATFRGCVVLFDEGVRGLDGVSAPVALGPLLCAVDVPLACSEFVVGLEPDSYAASALFARVQFVSGFFVASILIDFPEFGQRTEP